MAGRHESETPCAHSREESKLPKRGAKVRAPPAGRPTPELAGDRPKERRAPTQELDRPPLFFNAVGNHVFILDFGGYVSEVVRGSGTMAWGLVFLYWTALGWFIACLYFSSAPLLRSRLLCTSTSHFPLQLQEQKNRVEQFLAEARLRRGSVKSRVATEFRAAVTSSSWYPQGSLHLRRVVR